VISKFANPKNSFVAERMIETMFKSGIDQRTSTQGFWFNWIFARILLREATGLMANQTNCPAQ